MQPFGHFSAFGTEPTLPCDQNQEEKIIINQCYTESSHNVDAASNHFESKQIKTGTKTTTDNNNKNNSQQVNRTT